MQFSNSNLLAEAWYLMLYFKIEQVNLSSKSNNISGNNNKVS